MTKTTTTTTTQRRSAGGQLIIFALKCISHGIGTGAFPADTYLCTRMRNYPIRLFLWFCSGYSMVASLRCRRGRCVLTLRHLVKRAQQQTSYRYMLNGRGGRVDMCAKLVSHLICNVVVNILYIYIYI